MAKKRVSGEWGYVGDDGVYVPVEGATCSSDVKQVVRGLLNQRLAAGAPLEVNGKYKIVSVKDVANFVVHMVATVREEENGDGQEAQEESAEG